MGMDQRWQSWTKENLDRGCSPEEIRDILLKNGFRLPAIQAAMKDAFPGTAGAAPAPTPSDTHTELTPEQYNALANVRITRSPAAQKIDTPRLQLYRLDGFMTPEECDALVEVIKMQLRPSTISMETGDKYFRTSSTCDLAIGNNPLVDAIDKKIAEAIGIHLSYSELIQAQHYLPGQQFKAHTDFFQPHSEEYAKYAFPRGNRTWTFMIYLNDTKKGGGTKFFEIDTTFQPLKGTAIIWNNLLEDGSPNYNTLHAGLPVKAGEKIIITKWFRENGTGPMVMA